MMAMAMPAAIGPYSIAVAPDSSLKNAKTKVFTTVPTPLLMNQEPGNSQLHQDDHGEKI
jgi:hypothetical protein